MQDGKQKYLTFARVQCHTLRVIYRQTSDISRTKSKNINVSRLVMQLSLPNPLKPGVKSRMKIELEQRRQAMLQLHLRTISLAT